MQIQTFQGSRQTFLKDRTSTAKISKVAWVILKGAFSVVLYLAKFCFSKRGTISLNTIFGMTTHTLFSCLSLKFSYNDSKWNFGKSALPEGVHWLDELTDIWYRMDDYTVQNKQTRFHFVSRSRCFNFYTEFYLISSLFLVYRWIR